MSNKNLGIAFAGFALVLVCFVAVYSNDSASSRRSLKGGNFNVNGGWNQQTGANVNAGLQFSWKQDPIRNALQFAGEFVDNLPSFSFKEGEAGAEEAAPAKGWSIFGNFFKPGGLTLDYNWKRLPTQFGPIMDGGWNRDFGRQLEEGSAEKRDLSGNFNVNGGWNQQSGANVNAGLQFSWKEQEQMNFGPVAIGVAWKAQNTIALPMIIPGTSPFIQQKISADQLDVQTQWIGAIMRTAAQGGEVASHVLAMNSEMEKRWSWEGAARGAAQGAVTGGFTGLTGGPAGAAWGAGLGAVGGAIAGGTGWGRQLEEAEKRDLSGNFNVNAGWNQQTGGNVNAGLSFSWKETETLEKRLLDEVFSFTNNALNELVKRGISKLGGKAASYVETFSDDLRAVAAGMRTLAQQAGSQNREKLSINDIARRASFSWRKLIDRAQGVVESTPAIQRWSQALVAPVEQPETREKILGALAGVALSGAKTAAMGAVKDAAMRAVGSGVRRVGNWVSNRLRGF